jgi:hypothetical protein
VHLADEFVAIHGCHEDVADDQVGPSALDERERFPAVCRLEAWRARDSQQRDEELPIDGAILGDQDGRRGISVRLSAVARAIASGGSEERRNRQGLSNRHWLPLSIF